MSSCSPDFLLTLPFQQRFTVLDGTMRAVYLVTVACSMGSTVLLVAPVGMHRVLFRRHRLDAIVSISHGCAIAGLILLGLALSGVAVVIFDTVIGRTGALDRGRLHAGGIRRPLVPRAVAAPPQSRQLLLGFVKH